MFLYTLDFEGTPSVKKEQPSKTETQVKKRAPSKKQIPQNTTTKNGTPSLYPQKKTEHPLKKRRNDAGPHVLRCGSGSRLRRYSAPLWPLLGRPSAAAWPRPGPGERSEVEASNPETAGHLPPSPPPPRLGSDLRSLRKQWANRAQPPKPAVQSQGCLI